MNLRDLNREEWAEVPVKLRLVGGPADGTEVTWDSLPRIWRYPVPVSTLELLGLADRSDEGPRIMNNVINYEQTDHVADDGAHLYRVRNS